MPPALPTYRIVIETPTNAHVELEKFTELEYSHYLNRGSDAVVTCPLNYDKINANDIVTRQSWLRVYRKDNANVSEVLIWYGQLFNTSYSGDDLSATITMRFESIFNLLAKRRVPADYSVTSATDQSDIIWDIINNTQLLTGGDLSISQGAHPTSKDRTAVTELQRRTIKDVIESYTTMIDGVDFEITPTFQNGSENIINTYFTTSGARYHKGSIVQTPLVFRVSDDGIVNDLNNVASFTITELGEDLANSIDVDGQAAEEIPMTSHAESSASITTRYGLFEEYFNEPNISDQDTLDDKATEYLDLHKEVPLGIKFELVPLVEPRIGTYDVGDIFNIRFQYYQARSFTAQYRLYGARVKVDSSGTETVSLDLNVI